MNVLSYFSANNEPTPQEKEGFAQMLTQEFVLVLACLDTVLLTFILILMIYIVGHYIIRLKIRGKFVIVFYLLAFCVTVCQII